MRISSVREQLGLPKLALIVGPGMGRIRQLSRAFRITYARRELFLDSLKADNPGVLRALKTDRREVWHIGVRCDVTFYLDRIVPTCASHRGSSCERNISPLRLYGG